MVIFYPGTVADYLATVLGSCISYDIDPLVRRMRILDKIA